MKAIPADQLFDVSVCICTRNRPHELSRALDSLSRSTHPVYEVIVSDDSTDDRTERLIAQAYPLVKYTRGPRLGIGANRNNALKYVHGSRVLFIDDDVEIGEYFLSTAIDELMSLPRNVRELAIVSGCEQTHGSIILPHELAFLGFQRRPYNEQVRVTTIVINGTIFPAKLFEVELFDEQLVYGYDEVDIAARAVRRNFQIYVCRNAVNFHYPSLVNRDYYKPYLEASRLYTTFKRYFFVERKLFKALVFVLLATVHVVGHYFKTEGCHGVTNAFLTIRTAYKYTLRFACDKRTLKTPTSSFK